MTRLNVKRCSLEEIFFENDGFASAKMLSHRVTEGTESLTVSLREKLLENLVFVSNRFYQI